MSFEKLLSPALLRNLEPEAGRLSQWLRHFDLHFYRTHKHWDGVADLRHLGKKALVTHFIETGWKERRGYSAFLHAFIDPLFYRQQYPELGLKDDLDAVAHWMYEGFFEGRIPNSVTRDVLESEIHLFQFGKVASRSIQKALYGAGHGKLILHLHWPTGLIQSYPDCMCSYDEVVNSPRDKAVSFITGVRNPFERIISGFFEGNLSEGGAAPASSTLEQVCSDIQRTFFELRQVDNLLGWFGHRFFRDVDIYRHEFDKDAGYTVIREHNLKIFLYRFDKLASLERPLTQFTGLPIHLDWTNTSVGKPYFQFYKAARESLRFPPEDAEYVLRSQLVRHFFTAEEIDCMRERWVAK